MLLPQLLPQRRWTIGVRAESLGQLGPVLAGIQAEHADPLLRGFAILAPVNREMEDECMPAVWRACGRRTIGGVNKQRIDQLSGSTGNLFREEIRKLP
jgi:hypothetical protein